VIGFSTWQPLSAISEAPAGPGLFQVKAQARLLDYPRGKSAMIYYGGGPDLRAALAEVAPALATRFASLAPLAWRYFSTASHAESLARHLQRFSDQFHSAPVGNSP